METYKWSFVGKSDYIFFNVTVRLRITILGVLGEMLWLFFALIKHHIANAILVSNDSDTVGLSFVKAQPFGVPLTCPCANHRQLEELFVFFIVEMDLEACEQIFFIRVLKSNDFLHLHSWFEHGGKGREVRDKICAVHLRSMHLCHIEAFSRHLSHCNSS